MVGACSWIGSLQIVSFTVSQYEANKTSLGKKLLEIYDVLLAIVLLLLGSLLLRGLTDVFKQYWASTVAHTATVFFLPIITYSITKVIAGDIALSLGMVGALSIVRFRNPVRSPLELSLYFATITMGITAAVDLIWLGILLGSITMACIFLWLLNATSVMFSKPFFRASFLEGNLLHSLEIESEQEISLIVGWTSVSKLHDSYQYALSSTNYDELNRILEQIKNQDVEIKSFQLIRSGV